MTSPFLTLVASVSACRSVRLARRHAATGLIAAIGTVGAPSAVPAQSVTTTKDTVVSASRLPTDREASGSATTVIREREIRSGQSVFASEILRDVPGVHVSRAGPFGTLTQVRIRGAEANHLKVFIDGMDVTDPANGSEFFWETLLGRGLSRIEVARGAQSGIYGADALAGVVSISTPEGKKGFHIETFSEIGLRNSRIGGGLVQGGNDKVKFVLFGARQETSGSNVSRSSAPGFAREDDGATNTTLHAKLSVDPFPFLTIKFVGRFARAWSEFDSDTNFDGLVNDADRINRRSNLHGKVSAVLSLMGGAWKTVASLEGFMSDNNSFSSGVKSTSSKGFRRKATLFTSYEFETPRLWKSAHRVLVGGELERQDFEQRGTLVFGLDPNQDRNRHQGAVFGEYRLAVADRAFLNVALRYDRSSAFKNAFTWKVDSAYLIRKTGTRLHASVGRGVKYPSFTEQFGFFSGGFRPFIGNPDLRPETSISWDAGVEQRFFNNKAVIDVTFFQAWLTDEINGFVAHPTVANATTAVNVNGVSRRHGIEVSATFEPIKGLTIRGQYTYLIAQQGSGSTQEIRRPRHSGALSATYRFYSDRAMVRLSTRFNGAMSDNAFIGASLTRQKIGGYVLVNIAASYKVTRWLEVYGRIENAFNRRYEEVFGFRGTRIGAFAGIRLRYGTN